MHWQRALSSLLVSSAYWRGAASVALPDDDNMIEGRPRAHNVHFLDLDAYESGGNGTMDVSVREGFDGFDTQTPDTCCGIRLTSGRVGACAGALGGLATVANLISNQLKANTNINDCSAHLGWADGTSWEIRAEGRGCGTTAHQKTIQGALDEYIDALGDKMCGVSCLQLSHGGGTWRGYVTIATDGTNPANYYCGSSKKWTGCYVGGVNDAHG